MAPRLNPRGPPLILRGVALPCRPAAPRYLALETTAWKFDGTSANEAVRFGFTTGTNTTVVVQASVSRAADRPPAALRLSVLNSLASTGSEKFDLGRISLETADPTQPAYVIAAPSEAGLVIADDPRDDWRFRRFTAAQLADSAASGWAADPDGDGLSNFAEYAFGRAPLSADAAGLAPVSTVTIGDARYLAVSFLRRVDDPGLHYVPEAAGDLTAPIWPDPAIQAGDAGGTGDPAYEQVVYRDIQPLDASPRRFLRVRVNGE